MRAGRDGVRDELVSHVQDLLLAAVAHGAPESVAARGDQTLNTLRRVRVTRSGGVRVGVGGILGSGDRVGSVDRLHALIAEPDHVVLGPGQEGLDTSAQLLDAF